MYAMPGYSSLFASTCAVKTVGAGEKKKSNLVNEKGS